jgi:hypothetical protein
MEIVFSTRQPITLGSLSPNFVVLWQLVHFEQVIRSSQTAIGLHVLGVWRRNCCKWM